MLNIGKIRPGREDYYLDSVGEGVEDYYFAAHEAPGTWIGVASADLGLEGSVARTDLVALLNGTDPRTHGPLSATASGAAHGRLCGYDVTLRAPKSVSLLWALTTEDGVRRQVQEGHDAAVRATLRHLDSVAAMGRRGHGGRVLVPTTGFVAAAFRHRTSRAGDPTLHTHLVVPNVVRSTVDGRWSAPDGTLLYTHAKSAGYVYQALLRGELTRRLGVAWGPVRKGAADIAGTSREVIRAFSRRRAEIEEHRDRLAAMVAAGEMAGADDTRLGSTAVSPTEVALEREEQVRTSAQVGQLAALETRRAKGHALDMHAAVADWRARAATLGYDQAAIRSQLGAQSLLEVSEPLAGHIAARLVGEGAPLLAGDRVADADLCKEASTWSHRDALMGWCGQLGQGASSLDVLWRLTDTLVQSHPAVVRAEGQPGLRQGDGIRLAAWRGAAGVLRGGGFAPARSDLVRYTTRAMRSVEQQLTATAVGRRDEGAAVADPAAVSDSLARIEELRGLRLSADQRAAVVGVTRDGHGVSVVRGAAGTGKTTALAAARLAWEASGIPVRGAALSAAAARNLELATGIRSQTIAALLTELGGQPWSRGGVLVVDEAAMIDTRTLATVVARTATNGTKLVLVGDDTQLREIDAGGGFRGLRSRLGAQELSLNLRQTADWERRAVALVRDHRAVDAVGEYLDHDRVTIAPTHEDAVRTMVERWWLRCEAAGDGDDLMQARRNRDIDELNRLAHSRRVAAGQVEPSGLQIRGIEVGVGDRVHTRVADRRLGVINGLRGTVRSLDPVARTVTIELQGGTTLILDDLYLRRQSADGLRALDLAYATTVHRNQGTTCVRSEVLVDPGLSSDALYVAQTRGRDFNGLVLVGGSGHADDGVEHWTTVDSPRATLERLVRIVETDGHKRMSIDIDDGPTADRDPSGPEAIARRAVALDDLVCRYRASVQRQGLAPAQPGEATITVTPPPADAAAPVSDPHLLAIEALLDEARQDPVDAAWRYLHWRTGVGGVRVADANRVLSAPTSVSVLLPNHPTEAGASGSDSGVEWATAGWSGPVVIRDGVDEQSSCGGVPPEWTTTPTSLGL